VSDPLLVFVGVAVVAIFVFGLVYERRIIASREARWRELEKKMTTLAQVRARDTLLRKSMY
jgi:hypothetical protein